MSKLDTDLRAAYKASKQKEKIDIHLGHLETLIKQKRNEVLQLEQLAYLEESDVKKLEKLNIQSLFHTILGNKETQLEKERQEYLQAFLKLKGAKNNLKALEREQLSLEQKKSALFNIEKEVEKLLKKKEAELKVKNKEFGQRLFEVEKNIMGHHARNKEIKEAIAAGKITNEALLKIEEELVHVKKWGPSEMYGAGRYASSLKKKYIDKATKEAFRANNKLKKFEEELNDVSEHYQLDYHHQIEALDDFITHFIDNMITDWVVQKKIKNTMHCVSQIIDRVNRILLMLEQEIKKTEAFIEREQDEKKRFIMLSLEKR